MLIITVSCKMYPSSSCDRTRECDMNPKHWHTVYGGLIWMKYFLIIYVHVYICTRVFKVNFPPNLVTTDKSSYGCWSRKLCIILFQIIDSSSESNRNERMAFEHSSERERELMVWYQRLCGHRQSAHLEIIGTGGMQRKFTHISIDVVSMLLLVAHGCATCCLPKRPTWHTQELIWLSTCCWWSDFLLHISAAMYSYHACILFLW